MSVSTHLPSILITGVTGFLGKVVLEELFRQRVTSPFSRVFVLVRPTAGASDAQQRFDAQIASSPCFSLLPPSWKDSVSVVAGDLSLYHCGIDTETYTRLCAEVTHVIHCAGLIKFDCPASEAVDGNIISSLNLLALAQDCPKVRRFIYTSTAYIRPFHTGPMPESLVALPTAAEDLFEDLQKGRISKEEALRETGHVNIYSLTKCLAEHLLYERRGTVNVSIVRPSIISASWQHPFPGWIDSKAALAAFVVGAASGMLRVIDANPEAKVDVVPVDMVANQIIAETLDDIPMIIDHDDDKAENSVRVVQSVATLDHAMGISYTSHRIVEYFASRPRHSQWRRDPKLSYLGSRGLGFQYHDLVQRSIPLRIAATMSRIQGDERAANKANKARVLLKMMNVVFTHYTNSTYDFQASCCKKPDGFNSMDYLEVILMGVEKYLLGFK